MAATNAATSEAPILAPPALAELEITRADAKASQPVPEFIAGMLGKKLRLRLTDGRMVEGRCMCTDRDCNVVISETTESLSSQSMDDERYIGLSMVAGKNIVSVVMLAEDADLLRPAE
jgi:small nuclear ribonucleoprotein (snRNP)-like protein